MRRRVIKFGASAELILSCEPEVCHIKLLRCGHPVECSELNLKRVSLLERFFPSFLGFTLLPYDDPEVFAFRAKQCLWSYVRRAEEFMEIDELHGKLIHESREKTEAERAQATTIIHDLSMTIEKTSRGGK